MKNEQWEIEMPVSLSLEKALRKEYRRFYKKVTRDKRFRRSSAKNRNEILRLMPTVLASAILMSYFDAIRKRRN